MNKDISQNSETNAEDMRPEYDFSIMKGGVQGKYYQAYRAGHSVTIHKSDGMVDIQYFKLEDGAVILEPDVREYFPTSEAVNKALRCLIPLISEHSHSSVKS